MWSPSVADTTVSRPRRFASYSRASATSNSASKSRCSGRATATPDGKRRRDGTGTLAQRDRRAAHRRANALGQLACLVDRGVRQQDDELVAGVPADDPRRRGELAQRAGDDAQHGVALQVAVLVVDLLELVDVDDDERHRGERPALAEDRVRDLDERPSREQAGEVVRRSADAQLARRRDAMLGRGTRVGRDALAHRGCARARQILEQLEQHRIELSDVGAHDLERRLVRQRALVAPFGQQRVVHVGDAQHPRCARNFLAGQAVGVALAVPPLVVRPDHRPDFAGKVHLGEHLDAGAPGGA